MRPLIIVPTYNERDNLPTLVQQLMEVPDSRVLVVDDGSPDGTGALAEDLAIRTAGRVSVLHRSGRRGLGRAYLDGIAYALKTDADVICQMDADLSHRPQDLIAMVAAARHADLVIGSRYVPGGSIVNWPLKRRILSAGANRYVRSICGVAVRDCTSGFRCWKRDALAAIPLHRIDSEGYAFLVQLLWEAVRAGCIISEIPITFVERKFGASKLGLAVIAESALLPWRLLESRAPIAPLKEAARQDATQAAG